MIRTLFNRLFSLFGLLLSLTFLFSCSNIISDDSINSPVTDNSSKIIYLTGNIYSACKNEATQLMNVDVSEDFQKENAERSAIPNLTADTSAGASLYEYFVNAITKDTQSSLTSEGSVKADLTYSIGLRNGYRWQVTAGIRRKSDKALIMSDSYEVNADELSSISSKDLSLKPADGEGKIDLNITVDSSVSKVQVQFDDSVLQTRWDNAVAGGGEVSKTRIYLPSIQAGVYPATINFLDAADIILFSVEQVINVFPAGIVTEKWVSASGNGVITGGVFNLSSALLNNVARNVFYIAEENTKIIDSSQALSASDTNEGSAYSPLATISKAIERINAGSNSSKKYTIYIKGKINDNVTINCSNIESLLITNINGADAIIDGNNSTTSPVVTVSTTKPVTMTNIKITNGKCHGLHLRENAVVKLGRGVVIAGNSSASAGVDVNGGGVCMESNSELYMYDNAVVGEKSVQPGEYSNRASVFGGGIYCNGGKIYIGYKDSSSPDKAFTGGVYNNMAAQQGGGIYTAGSAQVNIYSGEISSNTANSTGGGIRLGGTETLNMYGGSISSNTAGSLQGGGVYVGNSSTFIMKSGQISSNSAKEGGGVFNNLGTFTFSGGKISSNTAFENNNNNGGALYSKGGNLNISGSAYVPFESDAENSQKGNVIYLTDDGSGNLPNFVITSSLTPPSECTNGIIAVIKPYSYTIGEKILAAGSGVSLKNEVSKFAVLSQIDSGNTYNWKIIDDGCLTRPATVSDVGGIISEMTQNGTIIVSGEVGTTTMGYIKNGFTFLYNNNPDVRVNLDMSNVTGFTNFTDPALPASSFVNCLNLSGIALPEGIQAIRSQAFANCTNLTYVKLPKTLNEITMEAFSSCTGLVTIEYEGTINEWNNINKTTTNGMEWNSGCNAITVECSDGSITVPAP